MSGPRVSMQPLTTKSKQSHIQANQSVDYDDNGEDDDTKAAEYDQNNDDGNDGRVKSQYMADESVLERYSNRLVSDENFRFTFYSFFYILVAIPYLLGQVHTRTSDSDTLDDKKNLEKINTVYILTWYLLLSAGCLTALMPTNACMLRLSGVIWILGGLSELISCGMSARYYCKEYDDDEIFGCRSAFFGFEGWIIGLTALVIGVDCFAKHGNNFQARIVSYSIPMLFGSVSLMITLYEFTQEWIFQDTMGVLKVGVIALFIASVCSIYVFVGWKKCDGPWYDNRLVTNLISIFYLIGIAIMWIYPCLCFNESKTADNCDFGCMGWTLIIYVVLALVLSYDIQQFV